MLVQLPPPSDNQSYLVLTPLEGGKLGLPEYVVVSDPDLDKLPVVPSLTFLLRHSSSRVNILFDLGIKKDKTHYSPSTRERIKTYFEPCSGNPGIVDALHDSGLGVTPADISLVFISHIHWDHVGNPDFFPNAKFFLGAEARSLIESGYPSDPGSDHLQATVPSERTTWLEKSSWTPIGPFERAHDYFGDGSLYVVDAPGHIAGHMNLLVRADSHGGWAYLAGDSAHDARLLTAEKQIGHYHTVDGRPACVHADPEKAKDHIRRITQLPANVQVWLAHDPLWREKV